MSDLNRNIIESLIHELKTPGEKDPEVVAFKSRKLLEMVEVEGLTAQSGDFYEMLAEIQLEMGELEKAREYACLSLERRHKFSGPDSVLYQRARRFLSNFRRPDGSDPCSRASDWKK
jgi:hypothetical protein